MAAWRSLASQSATSPARPSANATLAAVPNGSGRSMAAEYARIAAKSPRARANHAIC